MGKIYLLPALALYVLAAGCGHNHDSHAEEAEEHAHAHEHAEGEIVIEPEDAARFGIATDSVIVGAFNEIIPAAGRLVASPRASAAASAPVSGIITFRPGVAPGTELRKGQVIASVSPSGVAGGNQNAAAKANLDAARRELDRLTPLFKEGIVTRGEINEARRAVEEAQALYSPAAAASAVISPVAATVTELLVVNGSYVEAGAPVASLIASSASSPALLLEAYLPQSRMASLADIKSCTFRTPDGSWSNSASGAGISPSGAGDSGYITIYFKADSVAGAYPGMSVEARLIGRERHGVISVPRSALTEQMGQLFVYCKTGDHAYMKRQVTVGADDGLRAEITSGVAPGEVIVTEGVTFVKLAETGKSVPEGHSHNH